MADPLTPLEVAQARLANYLAAEARALRAQSYQVGDGSVARSKQNAELEQIREGIAAVQAEIATLTQRASGGRRVVYLRSC